MRTYELVTILSPTLNQDQAAEAWGRIKEFITTREAEITREQTWGTRRLAYPIRKGSLNFLEGGYYLTQFATERPFNFDLELFLNRDERVLRSLVTVAAPDAPLAQPGMAAAAARAAAAAAEAAVEAAEAVPEAVPAEAPTEEAADGELLWPSQKLPLRRRNQLPKASQLLWPNQKLSQRLRSQFREQQKNQSPR